MTDVPGYVMNDALQTLARVARGETVKSEELQIALAYAQNEAENAPRSFEDHVAVRLDNLFVTATRIAYALEYRAKQAESRDVFSSCDQCGCSIVQLAQSRCPVCSAKMPVEIR